MSIATGLDKAAGRTDMNITLLEPKEYVAVRWATIRSLFDAEMVARAETTAVCWSAVSVAAMGGIKKGEFVHKIISRANRCDGTVFAHPVCARQLRMGDTRAAAGFSSAKRRSYTTCEP